MGSAIVKNYVAGCTAVFNYQLLKEAFDMTKIDMVDLISPNKIALTESGKSTIVMNIEDYIAKELQNYK